MQSRHLRFAFAVSSVALILGFVSPALAEREVVRVEDGITVEEESMDGRVLPILTGTVTMKASTEQIAAWVGAVHTYVDWQHNCEEARLLTLADGSTRTYNRVGSPWPVSDRDVVLRTTRSNLEGGRIFFEFRNTEDANFAIPSDVVRMPRLIGSYDLRPVEGGTRVVYTLDSDPGGSLPIWLVKQVGKELPYFTLRNLRKRAEAGPPPSAPNDPKA